MRTLRVLALLFVTAASLSAQQGQGPRRFGGPTIEELTSALNLDAAQQARIKPMLEKFAADTRGAREVMMGNMQKVRNGETTREAVQAENAAAMMVVRDYAEGLNKDIRAVLTPEQAKLFDEYLAERARRMAEMRRPPQG